MEVSINFLHSQAIDIAFHRYKTSEVVRDDVENKNTFHFDFTPVYDTVDRKNFSIVFSLRIDQKKEYKLDLRYIAWFKVSKEIDSNFIANGFTVINAPAIAFPYLRSFVTNLVVSAGYKPLILPSYNFTNTKQAKALKDTKAKKSSE